MPRRRDVDLSTTLRQYHQREMMDRWQYKLAGLVSHQPAKKPKMAFQIYEDRPAPPPLPRRSDGAAAAAAPPRSRRSSRSPPSPPRPRSPRQRLSRKKKSPPRKRKQMPR